MTNPDNPNIINFDLWKQADGGRHQIGTLAGFKSEQVAGFLLECMAGFVGIRSFNKLKNSRRLATRYDKTMASYLGFVHIAAIRIWMRAFVNKT